MSEIIEVKQEKSVPVAPGFAVNPQSFDEAVKWCDYISRSDMVPKNFQTPEGSKISKGPSIYAAILRGQELGMKPMQALNSINVVQGRVSLSTDAKKAVCMKYGKISQTFTCDDGIPAWTVTVSRPACADVSITFSAVDAAQAGLMRLDSVKTPDGEIKTVWKGVSGAWEGYWKRMLLKRAMSWALDEAFPDVLAGFATTEDLDDVSRAEFKSTESTVVKTAPAIEGEAVELPRNSRELDTADRIISKIGE